MKQYSHAWLAFMAIKRLEDAELAKADEAYAASLIKWFKDYKDGVIQGAWYPDMIIKDMATSHVLKFTPVKDGSKGSFKKLPDTYFLCRHCKNSPLKNCSYTVDKDNNLTDRCESIAHSVVDNLKMQTSEEKGSPIAPNNNHIATILFMLSHYVADAHVPFHCDSRRFSEGKNIHGKLEDVWDDEIKKYFLLDKSNERFFYNPQGYPLLDKGKETLYKDSFLKKVEENLSKRDFSDSFGTDNKNVWDFMSAICQHSYLLSYMFIPEGNDHTNVTTANWKTLGAISLEDLSIAVLCDAIDSIAKVYFRIWRRYKKWEK
ncbi:MAG: hypothetical protein JW787_05325 [Sedimentisphaerales bacterium]|nr:hypothetical protein [Sedimentisphaerales bacterium]